MTSAEAAPTRRERLILAGMKLFAERGFTGVGVREIGAEAGVSFGLIRKHFGSKEGLREEVEAHVLAQVEELYSTISERSGTSALEHFVEDVVEWIERDRDALMYMRRAMVEQSPGSLKLLLRLVEVLRDFVAVNRERGFLQDGVDEEWAAMFLVFDFLGPAVVEPFAEEAFGRSMYERSMVERRNAFMKRMVTRGFLNA
ncbi:MAG: TetR/AcrR family transcriptional regulator [Acidobacteriota bacterium]|nr:TetR/AcrR family transcriptional regulator [Acidobacteriota bacterium]